MDIPGAEAIVAMLATPEFRKYAQTHPRRNSVRRAVPVVYLQLQLRALGALGNFAILVIALVLLALNGWLPKDRRRCGRCPVLAASSALGHRELCHRIVGMLV